ncbi:MAG: O-antigen ligase family protein, partial [Rhodothermales bacterium]
MVLLRSIAVMMALAWAIKAGERWLSRKTKRERAAAASSEPRSLAPGRTLASHPIVLLVILFLVSYVVSTVVSILPRISFWGYYDRLYGLYTAVSFLVIFFSMLALLRTRAQQRRLITTVLLVSIPLAVYGILQHFGIDPLTWDRPVAQRVHSTMGNPIFLAATLSMVVPLTFYRLVETRRKRHSFLFGCYLLVLVLQGACILFTQSRGPVLGMMVGGLFGGLLWTLTRRQWRAAKILIGLSIAGAFFLTIINLPNTPLGFVQDIPYLNRLTRVADVEGSSRARVVIWEGAVDLVTSDPMRMVIGYGPETVRFVYYPYYTAEIGHIHGWQVFPDRMHNETFDVLVTTGLIGFFIYLLLFTSIVYYSLRWMGLIPSSRHRNGFLVLWLLGGTGAILGLRWAGESWGFSGVALPFGLLGGLFLYLTGYAWYAQRREGKADEPPSPPGFVLLVVLLFSGILAHFVEINVGIAVSSTRLLFWVYTAFLIVLGIGIRRQPERAEAAPVSRGEAARSSAKKRSRDTGSKRAQKRKGKTGAPVSRGLRQGSMATQGLGVGLMLVTLAYSLSMNGVSSESALIIGGLFAFTWLLAGLILVFEASPENRKRYVWGSLGMYVGLFLLSLVVLFVFRKGDIDVENDHLPFYYLFVFLVMGVIGFLLRSEAPSSARKSSTLGIVLALVGGLAALVFVYWTNVQGIQANIHYRKAQTSMQLQRANQALFHYQRALELDPDQEHYQVGYAQLLANVAYQTEDVSKREQYFRVAEEVLLRAVEMNPYEQYLYRGLAEVYRLWAGKTADALRRAERYEQALEAFVQANQRIAESVPNWRKWAETYEEMGNRPQALSTYRQVLAWDSTDASLYLQIGALYRAEQAWQEAAEMYEGALRYSKRPLPAVHHEALIDLYEQLGRCSEALETLRAA